MRTFCSRVDPIERNEVGETSQVVSQRAERPSLRDLRNTSSGGSRNGLASLHGNVSSLPPLVDAESSNSHIKGVRVTKPVGNTEVQAFALQANRPVVGFLFAAGSQSTYVNHSK